jgi:Ca-activated chloride channel family protein
VPAGWVFTAAGALLALIGLTAWRARGRLGQQLLTAGRHGAMVALGTLMVLQIGLPGGTAQREEMEADIFVVVDISPSMVAEDWGDGQPRMDGVKADISALTSHYAGSRFCLITFEAVAQLRVPPTSDAGAVAAAARTLTPVLTDYAAGSSIDSALDLLEETLERAEESHPERARLVYYLGDGEQTRSAEPKSFDQVADLVDGGAVWGYGTAAGGPMKERSLTGDDDDYIPDPQDKSQPALSKIDEAALETIASDLGVGYAHRTAGSDVDDAFWQGELPTHVVDDTTEGAIRSLGWILALALLVLVAWEVAVRAGALAALRATYASSREARSRVPRTEGGRP